MRQPVIGHCAPQRRCKAAHRDEHTMPPARVKPSKIDGTLALRAGFDSLASRP
jgi:hypothetical protein